MQDSTHLEVPTVIKCLGKISPTANELPLIWHRDLSNDAKLIQ